MIVFILMGILVKLHDEIEVIKTNFDLMVLHEYYLIYILILLLDNLIQWKVLWLQNLQEFSEEV